MSRDEVRYIFGDLLPDLTGKTVVDVGSRLGAAVYEVGDIYVWVDSKMCVLASYSFNQYHT